VPVPGAAAIRRRRERAPPRPARAGRRRARPLRPGRDRSAPPAWRVWRARARRVRRAALRLRALAPCLYERAAGVAVRPAVLRVALLAELPRARDALRPRRRRGARARSTTTHNAALTRGAVTGPTPAALRETYRGRGMARFFPRDVLLAARLIAAVGGLGVPTPVPQIFGEAMVVILVLIILSATVDHYRGEQRTGARALRLARSLQRVATDIGQETAPEGLFRSIARNALLLVDAHHAT